MLTSVCRVRWTLPECMEASDAQPTVSQLEQKGATDPTHSLSVYL